MYVLNHISTYYIRKTVDTYSIVDENKNVISKLRYFDDKIEDFDWVLICDVETQPEYRHRGFASKLLNEIYEDTVKSSNDSKGVYLFVNSDNLTAIRLYNSLGFEYLKEYTISHIKYNIMVKGNADIHQFDDMEFS